MNSVMCGIYYELLVIRIASDETMYCVLMCMQIENLSSTLAPILIELLQRNIPAGVSMTVQQVLCTYTVAHIARLF